MTSYNKPYDIPKTKPEPGKHLLYGRELSPIEEELVKRVQEDKKTWKKIVAKAQALERQAYKRKMQKLRKKARTYEYDPA